MFLRGADGEPLLMDDIKVIKNLHYRWQLKENSDETDN
jgi:hypothetical protein